MRLGAINKNTQTYVYPEIGNKEDKYLCCDCSKELIFCKGEKIIPYFRHKSLTDCKYYDNPAESQIHKDAKMLLKHILENDEIEIYRECNMCFSTYKKLSPSMKMHGKYEFSGSYTKQIQELLKSPPASWRKMFRQEGISETPTIQQVLGLLHITAGGNESKENENVTGNAKDLVPPNKVREEAMKGINLSHKFNYPSYRGIGLARAIQLAIEPAIWHRSAMRMRDFFRRNQRYESYRGFNDDEHPSKSYLAWLNWGGDAGKKWIESLNL